MFRIHKDQQKEKLVQSSNGQRKTLVFYFSHPTSRALNEKILVILSEFTAPNAFAVALSLSHPSNELGSCINVFLTLEVLCPKNVGRYTSQFPSKNPFYFLLESQKCPLTFEFAFIIYLQVRVPSKGMSLQRNLLGCLLNFQNFPLKKLGEKVSRILI